MKNFRPLPLHRSYKFGSVNLIFGPNASGKTSLLEAIELFYCGRNKRNPDTKSPYELVAVLADGKTEIADMDRSLPTFRSRNLAWYGQSEVKTNDLFRSFSRFNFLDTDAAVSLSESTAHIEEDLSRLLVGPDASKMWRDIERVHEAVTAKIDDLRPLERQIKEEIDVVEASLKKPGEKQESDSIRTRLDDMVRRVGWQTEDGDAEMIAGRLVESLTELISIGQQGSDVSWAGSPCTIEKLAAFHSNAAATIAALDPEMVRLDALVRNLKQITAAAKRDREAALLVREAKQIIDSDVLVRATALRRVQETLAAYTGLLAAFESEDISGWPFADTNLSLSASYEDADTKLAETQKLLDQAKKEHSEFAAQRDQSVSLAQELRQIANRMLKLGSTPDECPLCHSRFEPGQLAGHMMAGLNRPLEEVARRLLTQIETRELLVQTAAANHAALLRIKSFCDRAGLNSDIPVRIAIEKIGEMKKAAAGAAVQAETQAAELDSLEKKGFSVAKLGTVLSRLEQLNYPLTDQSPVAVAQLLSTVEQSESSSSLALESMTQDAVTLKSSLAAKLETEDGQVDTLAGALSRLKERVATTQTLLAKLRGFGPALSWPEERPLADLAIEADSIRSVAADLQGALAREKRSRENQAAAVKRKEHLDKQLADLRPRLKRLINAKSVFSNIRKEMSLQGSMEAALQENRAAIETIFARIHSPAEFSGIGSTLTTLKRKVGGAEAKLTQISTGQRAAFGLSIFLAQNAQLRVAPPSS